MAELREDPLTGDWVVFAPSRGKRPYEFACKTFSDRQVGPCPFCPENEGMTPQETGRIPAEEEPAGLGCVVCGEKREEPAVAQREEEREGVAVAQREEEREGAASALWEEEREGVEVALWERETGRPWAARAVPNKFPALSDAQAQEDGDAFYQHRLGKGIHEVIIDHPQHEVGFEAFTPQQAERALRLIQERVASALKRKDLSYVQVFKNMGPEAGASLRHSHWQMIATPVLPPRQQRVVERCQRHWEKTGGNLFDDMVRHEEDAGKRMVAATGEFVAFAPYASRHCYEVMIVSRARESLTEFTGDERRQLGELLQMVLQKAGSLRQGLGFNICFQETPAEVRGKGILRWSAEVIPRMGALAGFEYATGMYINPVLPEDGVRIYR